MLWGLPYDAMHQIEGGLVKLVTSLYFYKGNSKAVVQLRRRFEADLASLRVPFEHDRKPKPLGPNVKTKEFKILGLFVFVLVAREYFNLQGVPPPLREDMKRHQRIFLILVFVYVNFIPSACCHWSLMRFTTSLQVQICAFG